MKARDRYIREISSQLRFMASWLPNRTVELGTYGQFDGSVVEGEGSLKELDFELSNQRDDSPNDVTFQTSGRVDISAAAGSEIPAAGAHADVKVQFTKEGAVLLHLHGIQEERISNLGSLKEHILESSRRAQWPKDRAVIIGVVHAENVAAMVASSSDAEVTLSGTAGGLANIADPALDLSISSERSMEFASVTRGASTPLYQAIVLRQGLLGTQFKKALRSRESVEPDDPISAVLDEDFALLQPSPE